MAVPRGSNQKAGEVKCGIQKLLLLFVSLSDSYFLEGIKYYIYIEGIRISLDNAWLGDIKRIEIINRGGKNEPSSAFQHKKLSETCSINRNDST